MGKKKIKKIKKKKRGGERTTIFFFFLGGGGGSDNVQIGTVLTSEHIPRSAKKKYFLEVETDFTYRRK